MRNTLIIGFILSLCLAAAPTFALDSRQIYLKISKSVHHVQMYSKVDGKFKIKGYGSGVAITKTIVATNCHVTDMADIVAVKINNKIYRAQIYRRNKAQDICLVRIKQPLLIPVKLRFYASTSIGEKIYSLGYPQGIRLYMSQGILSNRTIDSRGIWLVTDVTTAPGSSGGGLFDQDGHLIGITTAGAKKNPNISFSAAVDWIINVLHLPESRIVRHDGRSTPDIAKQSKPKASIAQSAPESKPQQPSRANPYPLIGKYGASGIRLHRAGKYCYFFIPGKGSSGRVTGSALWTPVAGRVIFIVPSSQSSHKALKIIDAYLKNFKSYKHAITKHYLVLEDRPFNLHAVKNPRQGHTPLMAVLPQSPYGIFRSNDYFLVNIDPKKHKDRVYIMRFDLWGFADAYRAYQRFCE